MAAADPDSLFLAAGEALEDSPFLELRWDALAAPLAVVPRLRAFCETHPEATILATCRRTAGGGAFCGSIEEQLQLLLTLVDAGAQVVDLELESLSALPPEQLLGFGEALRTRNARLLVSAHDFEQTGDLDGTLALLRSLGAPAGASIYKVVSTAQTLSDNLRMLRFLEAHSAEFPLVGICMGEAGALSRVLAVSRGAAFTFGAGPTQTAPGQISARALLQQYRVALITRATPVYGVVGNPIGHSLSPALHNAAFDSEHVPGVYVALHTSAVSELLHVIGELPLAGCSVTMPWKVEVLPFLDQVDPLAADIGAVNTILRREDGTLFGLNTDVPAIVGPLAKRISIRGARVLIVGAGGAARAAAFALRAEGAAVFLWNRTREAAEVLAEDAGVQVADRANLGGFDILVQATPAGMLGYSFQGVPVPPEALKDVRVVFEMVYRPADTALTRAAEALGIEVIHGLEMFLEQGMRQWALWTGRDAPEAVMRGVLEAARTPHSGVQ